MSQQLQDAELDRIAEKIRYMKYKYLAIGVILSIVILGFLTLSPSLYWASYRSRMKKRETMLARIRADSVRSLIKEHRKTLEKKGITHSEEEWKEFVRNARNKQQSLSSVSELYDDMHRYRITSLIRIQTIVGSALWLMMVTGLRLLYCVRKSYVRIALLEDRS